jgi:YHS domain-containing protein
MSLKLLSVAAVVALSVGFAGLSPDTAHAAKAPIYTPVLNNVAVEGHDAVAYFTDKRPVKGSPEFKTTYKGAEFRFASAENLAKFRANPTAYAPQYGGYCAWAVSQGYTAKGAANHWKVVNGKLYLNYNADVQATWSKDVPGFIAKADTNWPTVLTK